jgi:hypothetical protein
LLSSVKLLHAAHYYFRPEGKGFGNLPEGISSEVHDKKAFFFVFLPGQRE